MAKKLFLFLIVMALALFLVSCNTDINKDTIKLNESTTDSLEKTKNFEQLRFKYISLDGFEIYGNVYVPNKNIKKEDSKQVLLLHGWGQNQKVYDELVNLLVANNITAITMDFRGHGQSTYKKGTEFLPQHLTLDDYASFSKDINGVKLYLESKEMSSKFSIIGSDIGANVALLYASENNDTVNKVVLLSPSLNYYGITTKEAVLKYFGALYIVTTVDDKLSFEPSRTLYDLSNSTKKEFKLYGGSEHGTSILVKERPSLDLILNWISR